MGAPGEKRRARAGVGVTALDLPGVPAGDALGLRWEEIRDGYHTAIDSDGFERGFVVVYPSRHAFARMKGRHGGFGRAFPNVGAAKAAIVSAYRRSRTFGVPLDVPPPELTGTAG